MKKITNTLVALSACAYLFSSCGKDYSNIGTSTQSGVGGLFSDLKTNGQVLTVTAGTNATVSGTGGTVLKFYPNSFKDANGNIITSGNVTLQLVEMYKPGDMITNRTSTMANGTPLISGGQLNISATINGMKVYANKYSVSFKQSAASSQPMNLFYGNHNNPDSTTTWTNGADSSKNGTYNYGTTSLTGADYYVFDSCTQFSEINCDHFYGDTNLTTVGVTFNDKSFTYSNTQLFLVLPSINCVMPSTSVYNSPGYDAATNTISIISEGQKRIVPTGLAYKMVALAQKNGAYYYYETSGNITTNLILKATMTAKTKDQIKTLLSAL